MVQKLAPVSRRAYSSEMANALVQVSQNIGMGNAAIGLGGKYQLYTQLPNRVKYFWPIWMQVVSYTIKDITNSI